MIVAIVILFGGSTAEITSHNWQTWLGGAILIRFGVGLAQSTLVTYISEIAPFQIRGMAIGSYQLMLGIGQLISAIATKIMTDTNPDQWKPLIATEFLFTGVSPLIDIRQTHGRVTHLELGASTHDSVHSRIASASRPKRQRRKG
jgi:SP family general alpha glucoside:H+ symporter-like MFS transporter